MSFTKSILRLAGGGSMATSAPAALAPRQASTPTRGRRMRSMGSPLWFCACSLPPGTAPSLACRAPSPPRGGEGGGEGAVHGEPRPPTLDAHWDHEPLRLTEARSGPRVCDPQQVHGKTWAD